MIPVENLLEGERKLGFERLELLRGNTFKDASTVIVVPTRGMIHHKVVSSWDNMIAPMNQKKAKIYAVGDEVGIAYNNLIRAVLEHPVLSQYKYVMTLEDDNVQPPEAHIRLLEAIERGPFSAVSGIYFTKGDINMPMAYGDPGEFCRTGVLDFRPINIAEAMKKGDILEVNGIGMGCALWRMDLFREHEPPWFVTVNEVIPEKGISGATQDLYFCQRLRRSGKRIAVDLRVKVGHIDVENDTLY